MMPIIVMGRRPAGYLRRIVAGLSDAGKPPSLVLLGSRVETLVGPIEKIFRVRRQLGIFEAISYIRRLKEGIADKDPPPTIESLAAKHGFPIQRYDAVNSGDVIAELASRAPCLVVLAGTGMVDRAFLAANRKGLTVNGHPALLPGLRGVDVIEWALAEERPLGVTCHLVSPSVDAGDIVVTSDVSLTGADSSLELLKQRILVAQANAVIAGVIALSDGTAELSRNDTALSTLRLTAPGHVHAKAREKLAERLNSLNARS